MTILKLRGIAALLGGAAVAAITACAGDGATEPTTTNSWIATEMEAATVTTLAGIVGTRAEVPPSVRLTNAAGQPVQDVLVSFALSLGGGAIANISARTDAAGIATAGEWILGPRVGTHTVTAMSAGVRNVVFTATLAAGPPARIMRVSGYDQAGPVGSVLAAPLRVGVTDNFDNPLAGVTVAFTVASGGGSIPATTAVTDEAGTASSGTWTLGPSVGAQLVTAQAEALQVQFTAHAIAAVCELVGSCGVTGHIAFVRADGIYRANVDGSGVMLLVPSAHSPAWSPDASRIAFVRQVDGRSEIYVVNADGSGVTRRTNTPGRSSWGPAWSPDGRKIAFTGYANNGASTIYTISADDDGAAPVVLFNAPTQPYPQFASGISWSPNGARMAFLMSGGVHLLNADGTGLTRLTPATLGYFSSGVSWSPDGESLVVSRETTCTWDDECETGLVIVDVKSVALTTLIPPSFTNAAFDPAWSPDGKTIVHTQWQCSPECGDSVRFIKADGSATGVITKGWQAAWRP